MTDIETHAITVLEHCYKVKVGDGKQLLGTFLEVSGLSVQVETHPYEEGGRNDFVYQLRGRTKHTNVTLKSGVTNQTTLLDWLMGRGALHGPQDLLIQFTSADGQVILRTFGLIQAMPVRWTGPNANIGANSVATESLEIAHRGFTPGA